MIERLDAEFSQLNQHLRQNPPTKIFILADENTHEHCLPQLLGNLETEIPIEILEIAAGEEMKTVETAASLWEILAEYEADRKSLIINLGGGVVTDLGGFVASTFKRGMRFLHIPTTLLGMCDASIGGKTGIDHHFLKNIVGSFALPEAIFLYPEFLRTLPFPELRSGFAEMLKHGLIASAEHWQVLTAIEHLSAEAILPYIFKSMEIKQKVVAEDFHEKNVRKILNFGHTVGHAVESLFISTGKPILHGEAVALGMICETKIAEILGIISAQKASEAISGIAGFFPIISLEEFDNQSILKLMQNDKKNLGSEINLSLINGIGSCLYDVTATPVIIFEGIDFYRNLNRNF